MMPALRYRATYKRETHRRALIRVSPMATIVSFDIVYDESSFDDPGAFPAISSQASNRQVIEALVGDRVKKAVPRDRYKPGRIERIDTP